MKKFISIVLAMVLVMCVFAGCSNNTSEETDKLSIVTTIFPEYDWVKQVLGDKAENADVTMLLDSGVDLHSFQPTADDIVKISTCDLFIYVGGNSDSWVDDALAEKTNENMKVLNLMDILGSSAKEEEVVEGMQAEEEEESEEGDEVEYDEHVWLSLKNAAKFCTAIRDALIEIDPENVTAYTANNADYLTKLTELDAQYQSAVSSSSKKALLFGDRFPFRYMTDDYDLTYYAAFVGCSAESEASFETIQFLANKVDELNLSTVLTLEGSNNKIADTIISTAKSDNVTIQSMDSMQSVTSDDVANGTTYLSIMEKNLETLKIALS